MKEVTYVGWDAAFAIGRVTAGLGVCSPIHFGVVEDCVGEDLVSGEDHLERVRLEKAVSLLLSTGTSLLDGKGRKDLVRQQMKYD